MCCVHVCILRRAYPGCVSLARVPQVAVAAAVAAVGVAAMAVVAEAAVVAAAVAAVAATGRPACRLS